MTYLKEEYEVFGHEVTIQQVNEGGSPSTWIDGYAGHEHKALENLDQIEPESIREKIEYHKEEGDELMAIKTLLTWMVECHVYFCTKCDEFYDHNRVVRTGFAGHICQDCDDERKECPESEDGEHEMKCLNPSKRCNAKVPTKYKCTECGYRKQSTPTG